MTIDVHFLFIKHAWYPIYSDIYPTLYSSSLCHTVFTCMKSSQSTLNTFQFMLWNTFFIIPNLIERYSLAYAHAFSFNTVSLAHTSHTAHRKILIVIFFILFSYMPSRVNNEEASACARKCIDWEKFCPFYYMCVLVYKHWEHKSFHPLLNSLRLYRFYAQTSSIEK